MKYCALHTLYTTMLEKKFDLFTCNIETLIIKVFGDVSVALKHAEALSEMS